MLKQLYLLFLVTCLVVGCAQDSQFLSDEGRSVSKEKLEAVETLLKNDPDNEALCEEIVVNYIYNKDYEKARHLLARRISQFPNSVNSNYLMGLVYTRQDFIDEAVIYYNKVLELEKNHVPTIFNLAGIKQKKHDYEGARKQYLKVLDISPDDADAHYNLAILYSEFFYDVKSALYHYEKCLKLYQKQKKKTRLLPIIRARIRELKILKK